jgi:hypothetical protein
MFDIIATEDMGIFDVRSKFLGVEMEKVQLNIQVSWDEGQRGSLCTTQYLTNRAAVAHAFNPSTWEAEAGGFLSSRPAWSTE